MHGVAAIRTPWYLLLFYAKRVTRIENFTYPPQLLLRRADQQKQRITQ
jgi:hypothetical protein